METKNDKQIDADEFANLFTVDRSKYGDKYDDHLLEQYKLFVEMADKISERRATANSFFLSLNSFLLTVLGILPTLKPDMAEFTTVWLTIIAIGGIVFSIAWIMIIDSYKRLNIAKFRVIKEIEKKLPIRMYDFEWRYLTLVKHSSLSVVERLVPIIIIALYISMTIGAVLISSGLMNSPFSIF